MAEAERTVDLEYPKSNRTWQIIHAAKRGGYAVGGYCVYNTEGVLAVIRAAEKCRSPAIIQLFPWSMHFHGPSFVQYVASMAHAASVPIAVHLDHCIEPDDANMALECAFDSIMVDGSLFEEERNISYVRSIVERAKVRNITVEAELGRMQGSEVGLTATDLEAVWTDPDHALRFVEETGVHYLAPSFGNVHGPYPPGGAEKAWQLERLQRIFQALSDKTPLVLHGTHPLSDDMVRVAMANGMIKINENRTIRYGYHEYVEAQCKSTNLIKFQEDAVEAYSLGVLRFMVEVFGSSGKA